MPELGTAPWRSATVAKIAVAATPANHHSAWVTVDVSAAEPTTDGATWEGTPGSSLTVRFRWHQGGPGSGQQAPNFAKIEARLPNGGAQVGVADWDLPGDDAFPAGDVEVSQTFHFDDEPLDFAAGTSRAGMIEIYLTWGSAGGATPWSIDSRAATTGTILGTNTHSWARGYLRAPVVLSAHVHSRVALGTSDNNFAYPDSIFTRGTLSAVVYRAAALTMIHRRQSDGIVIRSEAGATTTAVTRDYSWTATSGATARVHGAGGASLGGAYLSDGLATSRRQQWPPQDFGGDQETIWATTGHLSPWTRTDERTVDTVGGVSANARILYTRHLQLNSAVFDLGLNVPTGERLATDLGFYAVGLNNNRNEPIVLPGTAGGGKLLLSLGDSAALVAPTVTDNLPTSASGFTALIAWDNSLPGGAWTLAATVSDAAGTQLPLGSLAYVLVAVNPFNSLTSHIQPRAANDATHTKAGDALTVEACAENTRDHVRVEASRITVPKCSLLRYEPDVGDTGVGGNLQYLNSDTDPTAAAWVDWVAQPIVFRAATSKILASAASSLAIDKPAGLLAGDTMVAFIFVGTAGATITPPTGWTLVESRSMPTSPGGRVGVYSRLADGTEGATFTWTFSTSNVNHQAIIAAYSGVDSFQPIEAFESAPESTTLSITTPVVGALPKGCYVLRFAAWHGGTTFTWPAGPTEKVDQRSGDTTAFRSTTFADELLVGTDVSGDVLEVTVDDPFTLGIRDALGGTYLLRPLGTVLRTFTMSPSSADPNMYEKSFAVTSGWSVPDIRALCYMKVDNVPLFSQSVRDLVDTKNPHDRHEFDPLGIFS